MASRKYANAPATALTSGITSLATTMDLDSVTGLPITYPYIMILDRGNASEEVVLVTNAAGNTLTITRGYDSTTAFSHATGAEAVHGISAIDPREANEHINAPANVHGVTGNVVGTSDTQTLTNKDLSSGTNTFPASLATDAELSDHAALTTTHGVAGAIVGTTDTQTLTNKNLDSTTNTFPKLGLQQTVLFTANGTFDKATYPWLRLVRVRVVGGGGGGGGTQATAVGEAAAGAGGGAGGYVEAWLTAASLAASETVTVGAGGAGGVGSSSNGSNGQNSTFGASITGNGGVGGNSGLAGAGNQVEEAGNGAAGTGPAGSVKATGGSGTWGIRMGGTPVVLGGNGGDSVLGGGAGGRASTGAGQSTTAPGGGGGGARANASVAAQNGGNGGNGIVIVELYA